MKGTSLYTFILCLIVYIALTAVFSVFVGIIVRQTLTITRAGLKDEKIKKEYLKEKAKKRFLLSKIVDIAIPIVCCAVMLFFFISSVGVGLTENNVVGSVPQFKVVSTSSMSTKNEKNKYLEENNLNNQLQVFDLVLTYQLPDEKDLKQYDIVVYEVDGVLLIHRIVNIEEPNEAHPNERWFQLQGDAVPNPDRFPVKYEQMKGIYLGDKIPHVGSFIFFMQSTAGLLCVILMVFASIVTPIIENKLKKEYQLRLQAIGVLDENFNYIEEVESVAEVQAEISSTLAYVMPVSDLVAESVAEAKKKVTFAERIRSLSTEVKKRYKQVILDLIKTDRVKSRISNAHQTVKLGNTPIAKLTVRGKTLCLYLSVSPNDYLHKKGLINDVSLIKAHGDYGAQIKLTSERRLKNAIEIINQQYLALIEAKKLKVGDLTSVPDLKFLSDLGIRLTFKERLSLASEEVKNYYEEIIAILKNNGATIRESSGHVTAKIKSKKVAKIALKGKTLRVYLALNPENYKGTKYKFSSVASVKAHSGYPMHIKITSKRKQKHLKELISEAVK